MFHIPTHAISYSVLPRQFTESRNSASIAPVANEITKLAANITLCLSSTGGLIGDSESQMFCFRLLVPLAVREKQIPLGRAANILNAAVEKSGDSQKV